jgi:hypothetical protein
MLCPECETRCRFLQTAPLEYGWYCENGHNVDSHMLVEKEV